MKTFLCCMLCLIVTTTKSQTVTISSDSMLVKPYKFMVDKAAFRFRYIENRDVVLIEKFVDKAWNIIDSANYFMSMLLKDINNDGYMDIGASQKWSAHVWLYSPLIHSYVSSGDFAMTEFWDKEDGMFLLDKSLNVYYDYAWYKNSQWCSTLFAIKNYIRVDLGIICNETEFSETEGYFTTSITVNKLVKDENVLVKKVAKKAFDRFDYKTYWRQNWKKFVQ